MRLDISGMMTGFGVFVLVCLFAVAGVGGFALDVLRVNGPVYKQIAQSKDLTADILPPPLYVIEAYLESIVLQDDVAEAERHVAKLKSLHKDFDERSMFWKAAEIPENIKKLLTVDSEKEARHFWQEVETDLVPAANRKDTAGMRAALGKITEAYNRHRAVVDKMVTELDAYSKETEREAASSTSIFVGVMVATSLLVFALVGVAMRLIRTKVTKPLSELSAYMGKLDDDNHKTRVPFQENSDEVGEMARAVEGFRLAIEERVDLRARRAEDERRRLEAWEKENAERIRQEQQRNQVIRELAGGLGRLSQGDLGSRIDTAFPTEFEQLRCDFNAAANALHETLARVAEATGSVTSGSEEISSAADQLARRSEQQAATLEQTAAALNLITTSVNRTSSDADEAGRMVSETRGSALKSGDTVDEAVKAMARIEGSAKGINQIIDVINEIAFQTNLLALNAGVEAARAGEAGRGFAVVAQEVRALAQRSANAAREIKTLIQSSSEAIEQGVSLVYETGGSLKTIMGDVANIDTRIASIAEAARDQARSLREVNVAIADMDKITQQNAAMVEESSAAGHALLEEAKELKRLVANFTLQIDDSRERDTARAA